LQETATVLEGASNADIKFALEALGEVTDDIIQKALEKADEED
jgi:SOS response regulatory protein OraA/RecX